MKGYKPAVHVFPDNNSKGCIFSHVKRHVWDNKVIDETRNCALVHRVRKLQRKFVTANARAELTTKRNLTAAHNMLSAVTGA
jgi:hypothetical protein